MTLRPTGSQGGTTTPYEDGFYLPGDTSRLARVWLAWPQPGALQDTVVDVVRAISDFVPVSLLVAPSFEADVNARLGRTAEIVPVPVYSPRLRDTGPSFLVDGKGGAAAVDWLFNGWGRGADENDKELAHALLGAAEVRRFRAPLTLEPSAYICDGQDTLLALAPAVFDPARNPRLTRLEAFAILQQWLGVARVIWVENAHPADQFGEIRALAAFVAPGRLAVTAASDMTRDLAKTRDAHGNYFEFVALPAPEGPGVSTATPASYTSFLAINGVVLVPGYGGATDDVARAILAEAFPDRSVRIIAAAAFTAARLSLASLIVPHPARLLERDRASVLPRSAQGQPPDVEELLQKYTDLAATNE